MNEDSKKQIIDFDTWDRKGNFDFFRGFLNPSISITSEVECAGAKERARKNGESFFLHYLYAILKAVHQIKELRYRLDVEGRILLFDTVDVICPIRVVGSDRFYSVRIPWHSDFGDFHRSARSIIDNIPVDGDPYETWNPSNDENHYNVILVSATPDLHFTSITHTVQSSRGSDYPLLNVGKAILREGVLTMPIALCVHHGFVDGAHLSEFFRRVNEDLK